MIIDNGGVVFLLKNNDEIIGSYALIPIGNNNCKLSKFNVEYSFRGMGLGSMLLKHALQTAKSKGCEKTFLYSHENLKEASSLYKKFGFKITEPPPQMTDPTGRCSFVMSINNQ